MLAKLMDEDETTALIQMWGKEHMKLYAKQERLRVTSNFSVVSHQGKILNKMRNSEQFSVILFHLKARVLFQYFCCLVHFIIH